MYKGGFVKDNQGIVSGLFILKVGYYIRVVHIITIGDCNCIEVLAREGFKTQSNKSR